MNVNTDLPAYADANGYIDVQALTCSQLAKSHQEEANALTGTTGSRPSVPRSSCELGRSEGAMNGS